MLIFVDCRIVTIYGVHVEHLLVKNCLVECDFV